MTEEPLRILELMRAGARDCLMHSRLVRLALVVRREVAEARTRRRSEAEQHARLSFQRTLLDTIPLPCCASSTDRGCGFRWSWSAAAAT